MQNGCSAEKLWQKECRNLNKKFIHLIFAFFFFLFQILTGMTKTLKIWTEYVKPDCLQYKIGSDWLAFIFGLFAKIWYFFSNFKFEQNV
jgi:hypothetical protein